MTEISINEFHKVFAWRRPVRWDLYRQRRTAPATQTGIYVFTTYAGDRLIPNGEAYAEADWIPRAGFEEFEQVAMSGKTVLYVGRAVRLKERLSQYIDYPDKCNQDLVHLLTAYPNKIWVRWTPVDDWEYGLIQQLRPTYNSQFTRTSSSSSGSRISLTWQRPMRWRDYQANPGVKLRDLGELPGYYVFTSYDGALQATGPGGTVWYVGRSKDLNRRMSEYMRSANSGDACNQQIFDHLKANAGSTWVRWVVHFDHEEELITCLKPSINREHNPEELFQS